MANLLLCDDQPEIVDALEIYLKPEGYTICKAYDGIQALQILKSQPIDLVLLDIMMPHMDGMTTLSKIREFSNIPVVFLSAKGEDSDKVLGLNVGADDYITKPFNPTEVIARVRSQLRRYQQLGGQVQQSHVLQAGPILIDDHAKTVTVDGEAISLTPVEYGVLLYLIQNKGIVCSSKAIYEAVWDEEAYNVDRTIAVHIRHLREKIEIDPSEPRYLKVVWGHGYILEG